MADGGTDRLTSLVLRNARGAGQFQALVDSSFSSRRGLSGAEAITRVNSASLRREHPTGPLAHSGATIAGPIQASEQSVLSESQFAYDEHAASLRKPISRLRRAVHSVDF